MGEVDGVFGNNWVERTNDGFFYEISKNAICADNVFVNCNGGIYILNSVNVQVYQSTLFNSLVKIERNVIEFRRFDLIHLPGGFE